VVSPDLINNICCTALRFQKTSTQLSSASKEMVTLDVRILSRSNKKGLFEHMVQKSTTPVVDHQISHENQKSWLFSEPPPFSPQRGPPLQRLQLPEFTGKRRSPGDMVEGNL
jgi:hypothetical protein